MDRDLPAHMPDQLRADRKAESRAPPADRLIIARLRKGVENMLLVFRRDPDARIADADRHTPLQKRGLHPDLPARRGELDGVAEQV